MTTTPQFDLEADVVIAGGGGAGLAAAVTACEEGASVIVVETNYDVGGHAMLSTGRMPLGGGTSWQKRFGIEDSPDLVYLDHTNHRMPRFRHGDRDLVRAWADECAPTFEWLLANGVQFRDAPPTLVAGSSVARSFWYEPYSQDLKETIDGLGGSGIVRHLEQSARKGGVDIRLRHTLTGIVRESVTSGRVLGITATAEDGREVGIRARRGVILATGGHTSNVEFRRIFDPRLTEEYQTAGEPWSAQTADSERLAMAIGAALWGTANQTTGGWPVVTKTAHIGCRWGYGSLKWDPRSPIFDRVGACGLTVADYQDVILVNQVGQRFWNETDASPDFLNACLGTNGDVGRDGKTNGGGPIWAIFDGAAARREGWDPNPPNVDPNGWFFSAGSLAELAMAIKNPYQRQPLPAAALDATVARYNAAVDRGEDREFNKPAPKYKINLAPFYAAWATPILHDSMTGLRINPSAQVIDLQGAVIPGLYCAGEWAGGFAMHGLPRVLVFGRIAGRAAAHDGA